ncbi:MAG: hypothetical protein PVJ49_00425 [Acidobacteriota bacterium]|jgi:hypothetical protein
MNGTAERLGADASGIERAPWLMAWALLCGFLLVALVTTLALADARFAFTGDNATLEIRVMEALRGQQLLGAYSRYGWSHPGPLYLYLLAPFYALGGRTTLSLSLAALSINSVALVWLVATLGRLSRTSVTRAVVFIMFGSFLLVFRNSELIVAPLSSIWNPDIAVLPFGVLVVAASLLGSGRLAMFPVVVVAHAFVTQAHVGFAMPASLAAVVGIAWALTGQRAPSRSPDASFRRRRLWLGVGLSLGTLCWAPPAVDMLWGSRNLFELFKFFLTGAHPGAPWSVALEHASTRLTEPLLPFADIAVSSDSWMIARDLLALLLIGGLVSAVWRAREVGARFELVFASMMLLQLVALPFVLVQLGDRDPRYLSEWVLMSSTLAVIAVAMAWFTVPMQRRRSALVAGVAVLLLSVGLAAQVYRNVRRLPAVRDRYRRITAETVSFADAVAPQLGSRAATVVAADESALSMAAGVVCLLSKRGFDLELQDTPRMRSLFGTGFAYRASSPAWIFFADSRHPEGELLARGERIRIYRLPPDGPSPAPSSDGASTSSEPPLR